MEKKGVHSRSCMSVGAPVGTGSSRRPRWLTRSTCSLEGSGFWHQDILQTPLGKQRLATVSSASSAYSRSDPDLLTWVLRCPGGWNFVRHGEPLLRRRHALGASEVAPCSCGATVDLVLAAHGLLDRRTVAIILGQSHDQNQPTTTFTTHFQTMTATTPDSGERCCQVWLPNIKVRL